jgi:hypothetical protein
MPEIEKCESKGCERKQSSQVGLCSVHKVRICKTCGKEFNMSIPKQEKCKPCLRPKREAYW